MYRKLFVVLFLVAVIVTTIVKGAEDSSWFGPELGVIQKVYDDCQNKNDFTGCLKGKALGAINKAMEQDSLPFLDGVAFVKQNNVSVEEQPELYEARVLDGLNVIDRALLKKLDMFFKTHTLKFDLSEGRKGGGGGGKGGKKMHRYVATALMIAMAIAGPLGLKALAAIAGKALVVSKVALTIAGIIALKKIFSSDHHEETSFQVHAGGHDNRRNTYLVRPVKASTPAVDPYKFYYEQQYQPQLKPYSQF